MIRVAILGASGYTALETIRILLRHPEIRITAVTSRQEGAPGVAELHPSLTGRIDLRCIPNDPARLAEAADCVFSALPHTASMAIVPALLERGQRVIDLSADYRLTDPAVYREWYNQPHLDPGHLAEAVYGLPELFADRVRRARLIANPGCYPTGAILALAPLLSGGEPLIETQGIVVDAKSGVSGAGRAPKLTTHFPECNESVSAYSVGRHRHMPEIDQVLGQVAGRPVDVVFTPHLIPMDRGIFTTVYARPVRPVEETPLLDWYREFYAHAPFVRVVAHLPGTKDTSNTNFCDITLRLVRGRIVVLSGLDNLVKGAAGAAVQNFNLMYGFDEKTALL